MEKLRERFQHCDERFYPHLERVLGRLPEDIRAGILDRKDIQFVADDGFRDVCMLRRQFTSPARTLLYLNTKMLSGPQHLILLAIATGIAFCFTSEGGEAGQNREAEGLLRKWGFTEELLAVRFDRKVADTGSYRAGYQWALGQSKDYLLKHFGLYLDAWAAGQWGQPSAKQLEAVDLPQETLSKLQAIMGSPHTAAGAAEAEGEAGDIDPKQAMLAGVMTALQEIRWREQNLAAVCDIRTL